ncbi:1-phosphofructokinase family hexose kinase [Motilibacter rhizosphaerae]|nr:hexose kinase [Motilibacter rhizosphaerae]
MILTVTLNPAWDVTYVVDRLLPGGTNRVTSASGRAGGKGVNVGRVLQQMGAEVLVSGVVGGATGSLLLAELSASSVPHAMLEEAPETRRTVTVMEADGSATVLNEAGAAGEPALWTRWLRHYDRLVGDAAVVVLSGSLPPWAPARAYAELTAHAHAAGALVVLDTSGPPLVAALPARPDLVKPNEEEVLHATGAPDVLAAASGMFAAGVPRVVVSRGAEGLLAVDADGPLTVVPPTLVPVNPTGAGDALAAGLALGLVSAEPWPDVLRRAVAWSAAAVLHPSAGTLAVEALDDIAAGTMVRAALPAPNPR